MRHRQSAVRNGFTLIELSIVLVIIGLIVGGVLTGRDLIRSAGVRNQIRQIQDFQVAFNTFQGKYNCIPGDCSNITSFLGTTDTAGNTITNGNGNGLVDTNSGLFYDDTSTDWAASTEMQQAFIHLAAAQMLAFIPRSPATSTIGKSHPVVVLNPSAGYFLGASYSFYTTGRTPNISSYQTGYNALWIVHCNPNSSTTLQLFDDSCGIFTPADMQAIDTKMDDGKPLSGKFYGFSGPSAPYVSCLNGTAYDLTQTTNQCQAAYVVN